MCASTSVCCVRLCCCRSREVNATNLRHTFLQFVARHVVCRPPSQFLRYIRCLRCCFRVFHALIVFLAGNPRWHCVCVATQQPPAMARSHSTFPTRSSSPRAPLSQNQLRHASRRSRHPQVARFSACHARYVPLFLSVQFRPDSPRIRCCNPAGHRDFGVCAQV